MNEKVWVVEFADKPGCLAHVTLFDEDQKNDAVQYIYDLMGDEQWQRLIDRPEYQGWENERLNQIRLFLEDADLFEEMEN